MTGGAATAETYGVKAIHRSGKENVMTTTTTRGPQGTPATAAAHAGTAGSPGTSGVLAGLLMVTGIGWNAGLQAQPFHPAATGVTALVIHVLPLAALMAFLGPALAGPRRRRGVSVAAVIALALGLFSAVFSIIYPHAAMGVHDINDALPIAILDAGALLWLVRGRRPGTRTAGRATA
jgi:prepilin signal peptidase PulO-like enzyme (type II secretory pathway)